MHIEDNREDLTLAAAATVPGTHDLGARLRGQESPRQTKPKKGPKRKVHENFAHFFVNSGVFP